MSDTERVTLAAVQLAIDRETVSDREQYTDRIVEAVERAVNTGANTPTLVALPEYVGLFPLLDGERATLEAASSMDEVLEATVRNSLLSVGWRRLRHRVSWPRAMLLSRQQSLAEWYVDTLGSLAATCETWLVAGTGPFTQGALERYCPDETPGLKVSGPRNAVYNAGILFDDEGSPAAVYRKGTLVEHETDEGLDLVAGDPRTLPTVETSVGRVGVAVCLDAFEEEPLATLEGAAADVLVQPTANPIDWTEHWQQVEWLEGCADAIRERSFTYGVNPMLVGTLLDLPFSGQSAILATDRVAFASRDSPEPIGYADAQPRGEFVTVANRWDEGAVVAATVPHPRFVREESR